MSLTPSVLARSLGEQIAGRLRDEIMTGKLPADEPLREAQLAQRFDVSRGPVREALLELTKEGLLVAQGRGGVRVAPPAPDAIQQLVLPIRRTIETYALRLFFAELGEADFAAWGAMLERMRFACQQGDLAGIAEQDIALHRSILERSAQPDLLAIWATVVARMRNYFFVAVRSYDDLRRIYDEHSALIAAFRGRDVEAAVQALEQHIW
jgi:DNA-binding GntR family transcriptional regulator